MDRKSRKIIKGMASLKVFEDILRQLQDLQAKTKHVRIIIDTNPKDKVFYVSVHSNQGYLNHSIFSSDNIKESIQNYENVESYIQRCERQAEQLKTYEDEICKKISQRIDEIQESKRRKGRI